MNAFDTAAVLITVAAICGYINHRFLRLPATTGTLLVALAAFLLVLLAETLVTWQLKVALARFLDEIDFNKALMHGMLCFLLFAAALHLDLEGLLENKWTIGSLSTVSVLISTLIVGALTWWVLGVLGVDISFVACLVFGALISPTDPIAVMGLLKELKASRSLEEQIAGKSPFNDGVSVVVFLALVSIAGLSEATTPDVAVSASGLVMFFVREVGGGVALGLGLGRGFPVGIMRWRARTPLSSSPSWRRD
jgi:CPA1 family monovalent cation:H+ antiporter